MALTVRRQVHAALRGEEVVALALALELRGELLGRDLRVDGLAVDLLATLVLDVWRPWHHVEVIEFLH